MTTNNGKFAPEQKKPGDLILSDDWNAGMQESVRLESAKVNRTGGDSLEGPLTIASALAVNATTTSIQLEVKGALKLADGVAVNQFSNDVSLSANIDTIVPTQKAVKAYIDRVATTLTTTVNNVATTLTTAVKNVVVTGMIVMWSGQTDQIPRGWAICNGQNGTPDLRDRFIVGAGNSYQVNATGGVDAVTLNINQMPAHDHSNGACGFFLQVNGKETMDDVDDDGRGGEPNLRYPGWNSTVGGNEAHENRPPFFALAFIMKLN